MFFRDLSEAHFELKLFSVFIDKEEVAFHQNVKEKKVGSTFHRKTNAKPWGDGRWAFRSKSCLAKGFSSPFPKT